ncbi:putative inactive ATP-dependent zinc metalloprotease FTSHI 5, chloroplastic, partial [Cucurbita argyrosperma subsp. argyrosperma]
MDVIFASLPLPNKPLSQFPAPHCLQPSTPIRTRCRTSTRRWNFIFTRKCVNSISNGNRVQLLGIPRVPRSSNALQEAEESILEDLSISNFVSLPVHDKKNDGFMLNCIAKPIVYTLFCISVGFFPFRTVKAPAIAAQAIGEAVLSQKTHGKEDGSNLRGHKYSDCTRQLLETVSGVLRSIEETRKGNSSVAKVEEALKAVKLKKEELVNGIMSELRTQVRELKREKRDLEKRLERVVDEVVKAKGEYERLVAEGVSVGEEARKRMDRLEQILRGLEVEYNEKWEKVGEIEESILREETVALSFGVRELGFIERECNELVNGFSREMRAREKGTDRAPEQSLTKLSKDYIQKDLENMQRKTLEQNILPAVVEGVSLGNFLDQEAVDFARRISQGLKDSRVLQKNMEAHVRKKMKKFGDEKRYVVNTPEGEVVKGFPEVEMKWMFGDKEVVVPKAISLQLFHGWKKWREEAKADLKRNLLENEEFGKKYVAQRQERILLDRDRVVANTWYNEEKERWEIDPVAVPYAVTKRLVDHARIRHDWGAMYVTLKGDEKEFFLDIKEFEILFEDFGGFDGLYMKMLACGIPTTIHLMRIPFSELDIYQQFILSIRLPYSFLNALWKTSVVSYCRSWVFKKIKDVNDDVLMVMVFPVVEFLVPYQIRLLLGMAWPVESDQIVDSTWYLKWQTETEMRFKATRRDTLQWVVLFMIRSAIYLYCLFHIFSFVKRKVPRLIGFGPVRRNPNLRKFRRLKAYLNYKMKKIKRKKRAGVDPITRAFDRMKRVKNPPIPLKDFASVESMREEINEVVAFLQNPRAFQEMGARAPRGVLIVGERGTGKTSLAMAIAAEAKVPVVTVQAQELEPGLWVGQSASNVRELFQTARDLAPVIIFVEDFDIFAGVRGKYIHTKEQDHEAFINQLLVELDGFEKQDGVVLMATTRNLKQIDDALQRPGRMDRVFHLQRLTQSEREKILQIAAKESMDEELIDYVDWKKVAEKTSLLRPLELKLVPLALEGSAFRTKFLDTDELMDYCSWFATFNGMVPKWVLKTRTVKNLNKMLVNHLGLTLSKEDLQNVVDLMEPYGQISNGIELLNPPLDWTRETKFPHAVWAAGRGLIALLLPNFDVVDNLWLEPLSWQGIGCTKISKRKNKGSINGNSESRSYLEKKLVFCFGSYVASQMLLPFGEENLLSSSELKQAQEIATRMVVQYGWGPDDNPAIYCTNNAVSFLSMGDTYEYEVATKVEKIYDLAYCRAKEMMEKNRQVLEKFVEELLEFEILTGKVLERLIESNGGIREKEPFFLSGSSYDREQPLTSAFLESGNSSETTLVGQAT